MRFSALLCLVLILTTTRVLADSWAGGLVEFPASKTLEAAHGHTIHATPGGNVIKTIETAGSVQVKASLEHEGRVYYVSDWSWERYEGKGIDPNWIYLLPGKEEKREVAENAGEKEEEMVPEVSEAGTEEVEEVEEAEPDRPLTAVERIAKKWGGEVKVYDEEISREAPRGLRIFAEPHEDGKVLKSVSKGTQVDAKATITFPNGAVYYASGWSWDRAEKGYEPNWMHVNGEAECSRESFLRERMAGPSTPLPVISAGAAAAGKGTRLEAAPRRAPAASPLQGPVRVRALLVGNSRYSSANLLQRPLDLEQPGPDVDLLEEILSEAGGEVRVVKDVSRAQMLTALEESTAGLGENDLFLFYYGGHGFQWGGKNYLAPLAVRFYDKETLLDTAVSLDEILVEVARHEPRFCVVMLDASRENPLHEADALTQQLMKIPGFELTQRNPRAKQGLAEVKAPKNTLIALSATPGAYVLEGARAGNSSLFAAALGAALKEDRELREVLTEAGRQVETWTDGRQKPWISREPTMPVFVRVPGRSEGAPDAETELAARWIAEQEEPGIPLAMAHLARSLRRNPQDNPASSSLLYLLSYQAVPVPLNAWGPYPLPGKEFAPDLQVSIDGLNVGLFGKKGDKPVLILDLEKGQIVDDIEGSFAPAYSMAMVERGVPAWESQAGPAGIAGLCSIHRVPMDLALMQDLGDEAVPAPEEAHAMLPILTEERILASYYDEGLERLYLALGEGGAMVRFVEYATSPPVEANADLLRRPQVEGLPAKGSRELLTGRTSGAEAAEWKLLYEADPGQVTLVRGESDEVYRRTGVKQGPGRLMDWASDGSGDAVALLFRDRIDVVTLRGAAREASTPVTVIGDGRIVGFSATFNRLVTSWPGENQDAAVFRIFDLASGRELTAGEPLEGHAGYASLSRDGTWFFYYDNDRRMRMADVVTGGMRFNFPATSTPVALPSVADAEDGDDFDPYAPVPFQIDQPPFLGHLEDFGASPAWMPDLVDALVGFRVEEDGMIVWIDDAAETLQGTVKEMAKMDAKGEFGEWTKWFLANRVRSVER